VVPGRGVGAGVAPPPVDGGEPVTVIRPVLTPVLRAVVDATVSLTVYVPGNVYVWTGSRAYDVAPSPKSHDQLRGPPVDLSANCTVSGASPVVGAAARSPTTAAGADVPSARTACQ
jgi:hypothetical protein